MATAISSLVALLPDEAQRTVIAGLDPGGALVIHVCANASEADRLVTRLHPDVVIAGRRAPAGWLIQVSDRDPDVFRIVCAEVRELEAVLGQVNRGETDAVLRSPIDPEDALRLIHHGCEHALLRRHNHSLVDELAVRNAELLGFNDRLEELVVERTRHLVEAQAHLQEQQRQVVQLETQSTVTHLLRGLAHEFNNPLAAIFGYAQRLRRQLAEQPDAVRRLDVVLQEVEHCRTVVQQLRQLATPLAEQPMRIDPTEALTSGAERLRAAGGSPPVLAPARSIPAVIAAPRALSRALEQILANAVEAGARSVELRGEPLGDRVRLILDNDGDTPDELVVANAVRPFFTTRAGEDHRGLGLSTAAALLREQDGTIELSLRGDGRPGARVVIALPAADPPPLPPSMPEPAARTQPQTDRAIAQPLSLVVDDEPMIAELLVDVLREQGHHTAIAGSVAEASAELGRREIRALVVDLNLPDGSGLDLARRAVAAHPALRGHVALTTGESDAEVLARMVAEHGFPVLAKPFRLEAVATLIREIG